jgi:hypothetical protein
VALAFCGCTTLSDYIRNGFEVGPSYRKPPAPVAEDWIDASDKRLRRGPEDELSRWWKVFNDPVLDSCGKIVPSLPSRWARFSRKSRT